MSVTFRALESAYGEAELKLTIPEPGDLVDSNLTKLSYNVNNSVVNIINDNVIETDESTSEIITDNSSEAVEEFETFEKKEKEDGDNKINIILISSCIVGLLFVVIGIIVIKKNKKL